MATDWTAQDWWPKAEGLSYSEMADRMGPIGPVAEAWLRWQIRRRQEEKYWRRRRQKEAEHAADIKVKQLLDRVRIWSNSMDTDIVLAFKHGRLSPEASRFMARRLWDLAGHAIDTANRLEATNAPPDSD